MQKASARPDDFFVLLNTEIEKERAQGNVPATRLIKLGALLALHADDRKTAHDGWKATLLAGRLGIPAPTWAIDLLEKAEHDAITNYEGKKGEKIGIDILLGFKGQGKGGGKNSPVQKGLQATLREYLCYSVRFLVSTGVPIETACRMVTKKLATIPKPPVEYSLRYPNAETLKKAYYKWQTERGKEVLSIYDEGFASMPRDLREKLRDKFQS